MPPKKSHSKERTARISAVIERAEALISDDPGQSLCILMDIVKPWMETVTSGRSYVFSAKRCTGSYESFDSKLALRERQYVLVQGILASQQPRFKSLRLLCMER